MITSFTVEDKIVKSMTLTLSSDEIIALAIILGTRSQNDLVFASKEFLEEREMNLSLGNFYNFRKVTNAYHTIIELTEQYPETWKQQKNSIG